MSFLSGKTKKVSVYGRKAEVRVVNRQSAFTSLENDENDPFGFFQAQPKSDATYGKSRVSVLPSSLRAKGAESDGDDTLDSQTAADKNSAYETADSSSSFHSASSHNAAPSPKLAHRQPIKAANKATQRKALIIKDLNKDKKPVADPPSRSTPKKAATTSFGKSSIEATPKARRSKAIKDTFDSPHTVRKPGPVKASAPTLPNESTPPPALPAGRSCRRAAQAARMAIEDYDFTDRDMTPRRPVPTKSYFTEKARQLAELAVDEEKQRQQPKLVAKRNNTSRKSTAPRPRHTAAQGTSLSSAIAISDSSLSSANGVSDSSFEAEGTSQSSFSITGTSSDDSYRATSKKTTAATTSKSKQNKRITRRIAATSDDEEEEDKKQDSDDESEQDPALHLAAQVADLAVSDGEDVATSDAHLTGLLASVSQTRPKSFADVIQQLRSATSSTKPSTSRRRLEKIGEASYSEVFKISASSRAQSDRQEAVVLKIIPISATSTHVENDDLPYTSPAGDVEREIRLMQLVGRESSLSSSFVSLRAAHVVRGAYPAALLQAWDRWDAKRRAKTGEGAENIRPHVLGRQQVFALLVMTDGGTDLESLKVKSWLQAASIFAQVVSGLGGMESKFEFEHRDLHWGNILVQTVAQDASSEADGDDEMTSWPFKPSVSGVKATIIDFTLSRARTSPVVATKGRANKADVLHYPFDDETLFEGSGDPQFDVYREMRTVTQGSWQPFCPATNILWLRYLAHKLVDVKCKSHKIPKPSQTNGNMEAQQELQAYTLLQTAVANLDDAAQKLLDGAPGSKKAVLGGRKSLHPRARQSVLPPSSAARGARKGRATMAVTQLLPATQEEKPLNSAAELMSLLK